ncbi:hypothetical protein ACH4E7_38670 [Kitasatospora sp. NPDC018058]|uniref:hypothetical protein n=1 Tax=Kitasatospora sp. NPDC018058 TaxID=3364025 RepID=UPI0037BFDD52
MSDVPRGRMAASSRRPCTIASAGRPGGRERHAPTPALLSRDLPAGQRRFRCRRPGRERQPTLIRISNSARYTAENDIASQKTPVNHLKKLIRIRSIVSSLRLSGTCHDDQPGSKSTPVETALVDLGGGIADDGIVRTEDSLIIGNQANTGGGIANVSGGTTDLFHTTVADNRATNAPGGILDNAGIVTLADSPVHGNQPTDCAGSPVPIANCVN